MVSKRSIAIAAFLLLCTGSIATAQECLGLRSLKYASANLSLNWRVLENARGPEGRLIFGREHGFGGLRAGLLNVGNTNRAFHWGADVGASFTAGKTVTFCPMVTYTYQPQANGGARYPKTHEAFAGVSFGARPYSTASVKLIPFAGAGFLKSDFGAAFYPPSTVAGPATQTGAEVFGGLGVQLGEQVILRVAARHRDGYGVRSRMLTIGVTLAPTRK